MAASSHDVFGAVHTDIALQVLDLFHLPAHSPQILGQLLSASLEYLTFGLALAQLSALRAQLVTRYVHRLLGVCELSLVPAGDLVELSLLGY